MKRAGWTTSPARPYHRVMLEPFIIYFVAIFPLSTPLLAGPSAIMSVIVVTAGFAGNGLAGVMTSYAALLAVTALTGVILTVTLVADRWLDERVTMMFSRITAIILTGLSVHYVIDGLMSIGAVAP